MPRKAELAKASFDAFSDGRVDDYVNSFTEDTVWEVSAFLTGKDSYKGHEGVREFVDDVTKLSEEHGENFQITLTEFTELEDGRVMALGASKIVRERDPLQFESGCIYTFKGDKISKLEAFTSRDETRKAAGLD